MSLNRALKVSGGRFCDIFGVVRKLRRAISGAANLDDSQVKDPAKLAEVLRATIRRICDLEASAQPQVYEQEIVMGTLGATVDITHNLGGAVRWYVVDWTRTTAAGAVPIAGPRIARDVANCDANTIRLVSYTAGKAIIRCELAQIDASDGT